MKGRLDKIYIVVVYYKEECRINSIYLCREAALRRAKRLQYLSDQIEAESTVHVLKKSIKDSRTRFMDSLERLDEIIGIWRGK